MSSPKNTATTPARSWSVGGRLVGAAAIGFAVLVVIENVLLAVTGAQSYGAPIEDVLAYYAANRDAVGHLRACQRPADRARALRRRARRADARVRARLADSRGGVRAGAADAWHHLHRLGPRCARERADSGLAAPAGHGGREPSARCGAGQPRDRRRLAADLRRAPRVRRLARLAARDRRAPRPVVTEMTAAAPRSRTRARTRRAWPAPPRMDQLQFLYIYVDYLRAPRG